MYGKIFLHHSSQDMHIRYQTGHKPHEYPNYGEKPDKCSECGRAFCYLQCFEKHKKNYKGQKTYKVGNVGKHSVLQLHFIYKKEPTMEEAL